jgi:glycosyltransferase involved in cell wall biosynthesis
MQKRECPLKPSQQPMVSVVIPAYKAAARIRETLDSVFAQTYQDFEIVLVNDGSPDTDALEAAIKGYDQRLIYVRQENRGPSGARNTAIRAARGKYIACLDSDDIYLPEHLSRLVAVIEEKGLDLVYSDSFFTKDGRHVGRSFEREPQSTPVTFEKLLTEDCCVTTSAMMASRQAMIEAGLFDERFRRCEDFDLWVRMSFRGAKMDLIRETGIEHRMLSDGLAADTYLLKLARADVYRKTLTLPLSADQQRLVKHLVSVTEGQSEMDLVRRYTREGRFSEARVAAGKAAALLQDRRSKTVALAVTIAPWAFRGFLRMHEARLARKAKSGGRFEENAEPKHGSVSLQSGKMESKQS